MWVRLLSTLQVGKINKFARGLRLIETKALPTINGEQIQQHHRHAIYRHIHHTSNRSEFHMSCRNGSRRCTPEALTVCHLIQKTHACSWTKMAQEVHGDNRKR
jgi:hypothetical protein